jgi:acetaldehyde dehydrogenase (acetylating)
MPTEFDPDLQSIQEARSLAERGYAAWQNYRTFSQAQVDAICQAMADAGYAAAERLGRMAVEETGYGRAEDKTVKNQFASRLVWDSLRDLKTVGVLRRDDARKVVEVAWPVGVIAGLTPSTNPTSTVLYKALIALKARNAIVFAPHPSATRCSIETARILADAAGRAGAPKDLILCMSHISLPGTNELLRHRRVALILATGGLDMVRAAHSAGKPAYGVGSGNVPVYVDRSADIEQAGRYIARSKAFDCSVICSTEQAVIADRPIARELQTVMQRHGAYFVDNGQAQALSKTLFFADGRINPASVGKTPQALAEMAGIQVPREARILVARLSKVGREEPLSREKLTTVLGFYEVDGWRAGLDIAQQMLNFGGRGHTAVLYTRDDAQAVEMGGQLPAYRLIINQMATLGAIGYTSNLMPAMSLGTGGIGGGVTGDNLTATHLLNIQRIAWPVRTFDRVENARTVLADTPAARAFANTTFAATPPSQNGTGRQEEPPRPDQPPDIQDIVQRVLRELANK